MDEGVSLGGPRVHSPLGTGVADPQLRHGRGPVNGELSHSGCLGELGWASSKQIPQTGNYQKESGPGRSYGDVPSLALQRIKPVFLTSNS